MTRQTRLWFVAGLFVTLLAVPVLALAATFPASEQNGANTTYDTSHPGAIRQ